jgi:S-adenosylmethionine decarboxylase
MVGSGVRAGRHSALGKHIVAEFWGTSQAIEAERLAAILVEAAREAGARLLDVRVHHFGEGLGITGVALLAESHISIHTWPEHAYCAVDVFVCGRADPNKAIDSLWTALKPTSVQIVEHVRGARYQRSAA